MQKLQKGFIVPVLIFAIAIVLIAGGLLGAFYFGKKSSGPTSTNPVVQQEVVATPTPTDETSNWKTYTNTAIGFEIKYPLDYLAPILPTGPVGPNPKATGKETNIAVYFCKTPTDCFGLGLHPVNLTLESFIDSSDAKGYPPYEWKEAQLIKDFEIDREKAKWLKAGYTNGSLHDKYEAIFFTHGDVGSRYGFVFHNFLTVNRNEFDQILSTFRFTQ